MIPDDFVKYVKHQIKNMFGIEETPVIVLNRGNVSYHVVFPMVVLPSSRHVHYFIKHFLPGIHKFVDNCVYSKNRLFRVLGSKKNRSTPEFVFDDSLSDKLFSKENRCSDLHRLASSSITKVVTPVLQLNIEVDLAVLSWPRRVQATSMISLPRAGKVCENEVAKEYLFHVNGHYISEVLQNGMTVITFQGPCPLLGYAHKRNNMYLLIGEFVIEVGCHKHRKRWRLNKVIPILSTKDGGLRGQTFFRRTIVRSVTATYDILKRNATRRSLAGIVSIFKVSALCPLSNVFIFMFF